MRFHQLLTEALANDSFSGPLRCRIAMLLGQPQVGIRPQDHPRTLGCVHLLEAGLHELPLHGYGSLESIVRVFSQHGIPASDSWYRSCVDVVMELSPRSEQFYRGIGIPGRVLDEHGCGGSRMIRAAVLARTGLNDESIIGAEIAESVGVFRMVARTGDPLDLVTPYKTTYVVRPGMALPSYYHLLVLAHTKSWRSPRAVQELGGAVELLASMPPAHVKEGSQLIAIALLRGRDWFRPQELTNDIHMALWIDQIVHLLKAGLVADGRRRELAAAVQEMPERWARSIHNSSPFLKWGAYTGVGLEPDWKTARRKAADLLFRFEEVDGLL